MTSILTDKQKRFIALMLENDEQERWGFDLLLKRDGFQEFFHPLKDAGLFSADKNPSPKEADKKGFYNIPPWAATRYLKEVAKKATELSDEQLSSELIATIIQISRDGTSDNYHTFRAFAELLSLLPTSSYQKDDLTIVNIWLTGKFENDQVGPEIGQKLLPKLLESTEPADLDKALYLLECLTNVKFIKDNAYNSTDQENERFKAQTLIDPYWLDKILEAVLDIFCRKAPFETFTIFKNLSDKIFSEEKRGNVSPYLRPAIEQHDQNRNWRKIENLTVDAVRQSAEACIELLPYNQALEVVRGLFADDSILQRLGIHLINNYWDILKPLCNLVVNENLFDAEKHHETYHFLKKHFSEFHIKQQNLIIELILQIESSSGDELTTKHRQRAKFSIIANQGNDEADHHYEALSAIPELGKESDHPDFLYYTSGVQSGFGPSPFNIDELIEATEKDKVVNLLNSFEETGRWREPSVESLCEVLQHTVTKEPVLFIKEITKFLDVKPPYQYAILRGFEELRRKATQHETQLIKWDDAWHILLEFIHTLINHKGFWAKENEDQEGLKPSKEWIPGVIANILESGTQKDDLAAPAECLPLMLEINVTLLENLETEKEEHDDPLTWAINHPRGKAVEALINHALRECRLEGEDHSTAWAKLKPIFDRELALCKNNNLEFSALAGQYLPQFGYMSKEWLNDSIKAIFPMNHLSNFNSALSGLGYVGSSQWAYKLLQDNNIILPAITNSKVSDQTKHRFLERIALAYIWEDEGLDGDVFTTLLLNEHVHDLVVIIEFFYSIHRQDLEETYLGRIYEFWDAINLQLESDIYSEENKKILLRKLVGLTVYIEAIDPRTLKYLQLTVPYAADEYKTDTVLEVLERLLVPYTDEVLELLGTISSQSQITYDYENRLENIVRALHDMGRTADAKLICSKLRQIPKFIVLHDSLN